MVKHFFPIPTPLRTLESVTLLACGTDHCLAYGPSGVWAWGNGSGGKLGLGDTRDRLEPVLIPRLRGRSIVSLTASQWHSMAIVAFPPLLSGGYLYTWGSGYHGQLAQGANSICLEPTTVDYFLFTHTMLRALASGPTHCLAITNENELFSWGSNLYGALGRAIEEKDVVFTPLPGHVAGFGALVDKIGRGFPRSISCGKDFSVICTYPYEGPDYNVAQKLMEEARIREQETMLSHNRVDASSSGVYASSNSVEDNSIRSNSLRSLK